MYVNYSGWTQSHGAFSCKIFIDEKKQDYELHFSDGSIARQFTPFQDVTADWNNDGDVYSQFGAWFEEPNSPGREFWSVETLVSELAYSIDPEYRPYGKHLVKIPGVQIPPLAKRPGLDEQIRETENRAAHQEAEKNRKMDALGIRRPGEPWAR